VLDFFGVLLDYFGDLNVEVWYIVMCEQELEKSCNLVG